MQEVSPVARFCPAYAPETCHPNYRHVCSGCRRDDGDRLLPASKNQREELRIPFHALRFVRRRTGLQSQVGRQSLSQMSAAKNRKADTNHGINRRGWLQPVAAREYLFELRGGVPAGSNCLPFVQSPQAARTELSLHEMPQMQAAPEIPTRARGRRGPLSGLQDIVWLPALWHGAGDSTRLLAPVRRRSMRRRTY